MQKQDISTVSSTGVMPANKASVDPWLNCLCRCRQSRIRGTSKKEKFLDMIPESLKVTGMMHLDMSLFVSLKFMCEAVTQLCEQCPSYVRKTRGTGMGTIGFVPWVCVLGLMRGSHSYPDSWSLKRPLTLQLHIYKHQWKCFIRKQDILGSLHELWGSQRDSWPHLLTSVFVCFLGVSWGEKSVCVQLSWILGFSREYQKVDKRKWGVW